MLLTAALSAEELAATMAMVAESGTMATVTMAADGERADSWGADGGAEDGNADTAHDNVEAKLPEPMATMTMVALLKPKVTE